jgi:hypothetical protein
MPLTLSKPKTQVVKIPLFLNEFDQSNLTLFSNLSPEKE